MGGTEPAVAPGKPALGMAMARPCVYGLTDAPLPLCGEDRRLIPQLVLLAAVVVAAPDGVVELADLGAGEHRLVGSADRGIPGRWLRLAGGRELLQRYGRAGRRHWRLRLFHAGHLARGAFLVEE